MTLSATTEEPKVTSEMLRPVMEKVRRGHLQASAARLRRRLRTRLQAPAGPTPRAACEWDEDIEDRRSARGRVLATLAKRINTKPRDAELIVANEGRVLVKPSMNARALDVPRTANRLFAAALRPTRRSAPMVVATKRPRWTTAEAKKMGITGLVGGYTTDYTGDANRVHNVRLVAN